MSLIDDLFSLQAQDTGITDLKRKVRDLPSRRTYIEKPVVDFENRILDAQKDIARYEARIRESEENLEALNEEIKVLDHQRQSLRKTNELGAMERQIAAKHQQEEDLRSLIAAGRAKIEASKTAVAENEARLAHAKEELAPEVNKINRQLAEAQCALVAAEAERESFQKVLDTPEARKFLGYYERLGKRFQPVIVRLHGMSCPGCHMVLPASKIQEAKKNGVVAPKDMKIVACDSCGRLLFP